MTFRTLLFLFALVAVSCGTRDIYINVLVPAPVPVASSITNIGILNRSIPADRNKTVNTVHQVISAETYTMLTEGSTESIRGLQDALLQNHRFDSVTLLDTAGLNNSNTMGVFSAPMSWESIDAICRANRLDALIVLELFDTELKINPGTVPVIPTAVPDPSQILNTLQNVNLTTLVRTGWRIYNPATRVIMDEYTLIRTMNFNARGNILAAADAVLQRKAYVKQAANICGYAYSDRVVPHWFREQREYYAKGGGSPNFKIANRKVRTANWKGAAEFWQKDVKSSKRKTAGRACFNLALANEVNGNINEALTWSQKAYEDYKIRSALNYIQILKARQREISILNQ